jgi:hypothetical protein
MSTFRHRHPLRWYGAAFLLFLASIFALVQQYASNNLPSREPTLHILSDLSKLPIAFIPNVGQAARDVRYMAHGSGATIVLLQSQVELLPDPTAHKPGLNDAADPPTRAQPAPLVLAYEGANAEAALRSDGPLPGKANYLLGDSTAQWYSNLPTFSGVTYHSLYPGVDLQYHGMGAQLESDYTIAPGADPGQIRASYVNNRALSIDRAGNLHIASQSAPIESAPAAWQEIGGLRVPISAGYVASVGGDVSFRLGLYDKSKPLHVSTALVYSTYLGGSGRDNGTLIAVDSAGSAFAIGMTNSTDFPLVNPIQSHSTNDDDVFISKLNPAGTALDYSTYLGGNGHEEPWGVNVDAADSAYVAGFTSSTDFPTANPFQATNHGLSDAFLAKLSPSGSSLVYSTYLGGTGDDHAWGMTLAGYTAFITGDTWSTDFPTAHPLQATNLGGRDTFVARFNYQGNGLVFSTYLGGSGDDVAEALGTDLTGDVYVTGGTSSGDLNVPTGNVYQPVYQGGDDVFLAKISADGSSLDFCTYLGGSGYDMAWALAVAPNGDIVLTGGTNSADFPTRHAVQAVKNFDVDGFVSRLSSSGSWMVYSTFLGGNGDYDAPYGAAIDAAGDAYISGITNSTDYPTANPVQAHSGGANDGFLSELAPSGQPLLFSTYLGGSSDDWAWGMAVDAQGNMYTTGTPRSPNFPVANAFQPQSAGNDDSFITKVGAITGPTPTPPACNVTFTDVPVGSTYYPYIYCLVCDGVITGYSDNTFRPNADITRGQLAKIVSNSAGYSEQIPIQLYQDVPLGSPFANYVGRLAYRGTVTGYRCGRPGAPCIPPGNLSYFLPNANVTRGQAAKIVASTAALPAPPTGAQTFEDVPPSNPFNYWIEQMASSGVIGGYACGGPGEPCVAPQNRPYFRPAGDITRGQAAKIVASIFYQTCVRSHR